ncbi:hypothetical protein G7Y89_g4930 [Cudoniella acicularis]|uniref:Uncharacterized protein n=1 Tax=Cudoniella acicularis TaxID=354080 RepID=A0A8H4RPX7_9HELO|nr:hypothetical protein G7Y89_g4930 [Cudoniella acicularis]
MALVNLEEEIERRMKAASQGNLSRRMEPAISLPIGRVPPYFWGEDIELGQPLPAFRVETGYLAARELAPDGTLESWEELGAIALAKLTEVFNEFENSEASSEGAVTEISLSESLQQWRKDQHSTGRVLPSKGNGITPASMEVLEVFRVHDWPPPLLTNNAMFGAGVTNMLIGAYDAETLYSNYCNDVAFYYEHGYHKVFPEFESLLKQASNDAHAMQTLGGIQRRQVAEVGFKYIRSKVALEEKHMTKLAYRTAKVNRREALILCAFESSIVGIAAEAMARGYDKAGVMNDFAFSSPGTDVIDVGSDIHNSELFNTFLNTADITESGIITEENLRRVYNAFAHTCARMYTERLSEPGVRVCVVLYTWHILNNRHEFLRRIVLGYSKVRKSIEPQREADWCEAFDATLRTTGFSRLLEGQCNGERTCDQVELRLSQYSNHKRLVELWQLLAIRPLEYAIRGVVCNETEQQLAEALRVCMANCYSVGLVDEMTWFIAHASLHAWQVNYLFEAAMFGSLLDDGGLRYQLDRVA